MNPPIVLVFAGNDPTGGAGLQADAEALMSMGCHAAPVVTAVTVQDTFGLKGFLALEPSLVVDQARAILEDMPVAAFKVGMVGSVANLEAIATIIADYPSIPTVVDPVLASGRGDPLSDEPLEPGFRSLLCPLATLLTPNSREARRLVPEADTLEACAQGLMSLGSRYVLITGTHEPTDAVVHLLYGNRQFLERFSYRRLPGAYHGSGCTLASGCAAVLAQGLEPVNAIIQALDYTHKALEAAWSLGMGQQLPDRLFWAREDEADQN
ncbi:hydroxymethylpyrimidine/phosphomethylpyrimidine kinase [Acidiferrobacter sp.]|uniref:bifunctional hydroxymethylpyrimidine kinase/phosphomethylpyrimidine kinase n=1 Tax=Acidiferrobacter sp. TaxID=1872107 RepID=UPI00263A3471|nr:hydroxymethylpyrimidine/phosphomethylpyrimidine kinase [Acidiferrobacter sp.]